MPKLTSKEPTLDETCLEELARMNKTRGYPDNRRALEDYCAALKVMETIEGVRSLVDELTRSEWIFMPSAASIRGMAYDRMKDIIVRRRACELCGGAGVQTVWLLQTYAGKSFSMKGRSYLHQITTQEQADKFARDLQKFLDINPGADRQQVLSAARECPCRRRATA